jgi:hypothetical protein
MNRNTATNAIAQGFLALCNHNMPGSVLRFEMRRNPHEMGIVAVLRFETPTLEKRYT